MFKYFKGRYYKHQCGDTSICFVIGSTAQGGFVQAITNGKVWQSGDEARYGVSDQGLWVDMPGIQGEVYYGPFTPLKRDIMGPFRHLPMQCRHEVVSMEHALSGGFFLDGQWINLAGGKGYIEGDCGRSFPKEYLWMHCNQFEDATEPLSIMAAVAHIPICGTSFNGCICAVCWQGKEYRLATYKGVRIVKASQQQLLLTQGALRLQVDMEPRLFHPLKAPQAGKMVRTIHESNCTQARFRLWQGDALLFDVTSSQCSVECNLESLMR